MTKDKTILIVDDNQAVRSALSFLLKDLFGQILTQSSPNNLRSIISRGHPDVVLLDMNFSDPFNSGNEGFYWLHEIKRMRPTLPVVLFTAYGDIALAVRGIKEGATDFVLKPWDNARLIETLEKACGQDSTEWKRRVVPSTMYWGSSAVMHELQILVEKIAVTDANILITGENGTGKEMLAREIHALSNRFAHEMVTVDMGAVTETLFESELFGHRKGAFTDAHADRVGKFEAARGSTIFLDEIGNLPYSLQAKLLTVLQSRSVVRVGSNEPIPVDVRLICATNADLEERVAQGKFREDLLYRINTIHLEIPPLREREEDIIPLAELFANRFAKQYDRGPMVFSESAQVKLKEHPWYGNIRELEHAIEKAVIISEGDVLTDAHFHFSKKSLKPVQNSEAETIADMELMLIRKALDKHEGNLSSVAAQLGITRQTLYNKMKKYGL